MKNWIITLVGVGLMLSVVTLVWAPLATFLAVDSCLDAGGSFNYASRVCDFEQSHLYVSESYTVRLGLASVLALSGVAMTIVARYRRRGVSPHAF
jgi:hypothetical protein